METLTSLIPSLSNNTFLNFFNFREALNRCTQRLESLQAEEILHTETKSSCYFLEK